MEYVVFCLLGYLFGSVTFGYLIPRLIKGVDVRALSSDGNPGTANAFLYGGVFCGILVLLADLGKGALPVFLAARHLDPEEKLFALVMAAPVVGHAYPLIDRYGKGGKAIAVSFGAFILFFCRCFFWPGFICFSPWFWWWSPTVSGPALRF